MWILSTSQTVETGNQMEPVPGRTGPRVSTSLSAPHPTPCVSVSLSVFLCFFVILWSFFFCVCVALFQSLNPI